MKTTVTRSNRPPDGWSQPIRPFTSSRWLEIWPDAVHPSLGFSAVRPLVRAMVGDLLQHAASIPLLTSLAPELVFLFPLLKERPEFSAAPPLAAIAVPPSRRRLHKESEQAFRVTQAIVHLILAWAHETGGGCHLLFCDAGRLDDHSLRVFMRLADVASDVLSASAFFVTRRSGQSTAQPAESDATSAPASFLRRAATREKILQVVKARAVSRCTTLHSELLDRQPHPRASASAGIEPWGQTEEATRTHAFERALSAGDTGAAGRALLKALEVSVFTQNNDHAQWLVERALPIFPQLESAVKREALIHLAIAHAFTLNFPLALTVMDASYEHATTALEKAESRFFAGVLLIKRLGRRPEGRDRVAQALAYIADDASPQADVERAWLENLMALSYVDEKRLDPARDCCNRVLENLKKTGRSPDATHIKINVITNISVLDELGKDLGAALARWSFFEPFLVKAGPVFNKHYLFRKGSLLAMSGHWQQAVAELEQCYRLMDETRDFFYGDVVARGIAGILYRSGQFEAAAAWFERSIAAKAVLLADKDLGRVLFALALCLERAGRSADAAHVLAQIADSASAADARLLAGLAQWRAGGVAGLEAAIEAWATPMPTSKLNRPFDFTNFF